MGFISDLLGAKNNFQANNGVNPWEQQAAAAQSSNAIVNQQRFTDAVNRVDGLGNQQSTFNQLQNVANGQGPNPAQAQLANATGANVANQAALMAGQRGASQNAGLIARQAAQQGANLQQQAVGQGAALQAQQSLGALNQLGGIAGQQVAQQQNAANSYTQLAQNQQSNLFNAVNQQNQINSGTAAQNAKTNGGIAGGILGGVGSVLGLAHGGQVPMYAEGGEVAAEETKGPRSGAGKFLSSFAKGSGLGGEVDPLSAGIAGLMGGANKAVRGALAPQSPMGAANQFAQNVQGQSQLMGANPVPGANLGVNTSLGAQIPQAPMPMQYNLGAPQFAQGGKVDAMVSPGEVYLPPNKAKEVAKGKADPMKAGKKIPGKAKVKGDSYDNDTVPTQLEEGGIVIPRSISEGKDAAKNAAAFVQAVLNQSAKRRK